MYSKNTFTKRVKMTICEVRFTAVCVILHVLLVLFVLLEEGELKWPKPKN